MLLVGNKLAIVLIAAGFLAGFLLNPGIDRHRAVFMDHAQENFFTLPRSYQQIYESLRNEQPNPSAPPTLRYGNFLLFSTLSYDLSAGMRQGKQWRDRRPLTIGMLGFVFPVTVEPQSAPPPAE